MPGQHRQSTESTAQEPAVIERIAQWAAAGPSFSELARQRARDAIVDTLGCMMAGAADVSTAAVRAAFAHAFSGPGASLVAGGGRAHAAVAACINGTAAHALDFDDSFVPAITHASAILVPALLAIGQARGARGLDIIDAYLIGLEAQAVIGRGLNPVHYAAGWHASSTVGCIGSAAGTAWLMGLDPMGIARAMSVAASMAGGMKGQFGTPVKPLHVGLAARNAVEAALFGAAGMTGRLDILSRPQGVLELFGGPEAPGWIGPVVPGAPHSIESDGLRPKRHPCCGATHNTVDALLDLRSEHGFRADEVRSVCTIVSRSHARNLPYAVPEDEMQARFSMNYCAALALTQDRLTLADFTPQAVGRAALAPLMARIDMRCYDAGVDAAAQGRPPHRITVELAGGARLSAERFHPKGSIAEPLSEQDLATKFADCAAHLPEDIRQGLYDGLRRLDLAPNLEFLSAAFCWTPAATHPA